MKNELKSLNNDLILRARQGKCGEINIHEMLKAISVLDKSDAGQAYLLNHHSDAEFDDLVKMLNEITYDMRDGKMNIADLTTKYIDLIPPIDGPQIEEEISQIE
ncbi:MAG: hypothetical protein WCF28_10400 [Methanobacterium sp.]|uniref:hypothetical protein n=1 Tax=Methanobacterium sp. TaxID=2164 RepID=UPI003C788A46